VRILVTGAFGNIGTFATRELVLRGHQVRCLDLKTRTNVRTARRLEAWASRFGGRLEVLWGDLRRPEDCSGAATGQDAIIHLAGIIPPASEARPDLAYRVNVGGTAALLDAARDAGARPRFVFASSVSVYGNAQGAPPPRTADDPVCPSDHYSSHKVEGERLVRESGLEWVILRYGAVPTVTLPTLSPAVLRTMFEVPLDTRIELVHPADAGLAAANAALAPRAVGKVLLIGGGPTCQLYQRVYVGRMLAAAGIGHLPDRAFGRKPFYTDWLDTAESQGILAYQRHTAEDYFRELAQAMGAKRPLARLFRHAVQAWMLRYSPYYVRRPQPRRKVRLA